MPTLPTNPASGCAHPPVPAAALVAERGWRAVGALTRRLPAAAPHAIVRAGIPGRARRSKDFLAERKEEFGTALLAPIKPRVRAAFHGWLSARAAGILFREPDPAEGTAAAPVPRETTHRSVFHGWLAGRESSRLCCETRSGDEGYHVSVLPEETLRWMAAGPGSFVIDGTLGGGGHSERFLEAGAEVLGIDRDPEALAFARRRLDRFGDRFRTAEGNFADVLENPATLGERRADGLLLDLGVSSRQLDAAERGFSFREEGPLDMRMGPGVELDAARLVNEWPEAELVRILREYGEEPKARRIAAAIVEGRARKPFATTTELADCIERRVPRSGRIHPATRSFQAIRIAVNDELGSLERALEASVGCLKPGGRLLVITFHSLEDRIVKRFFHERSRRWIDRPEWPEPRPNPRWQFRLPQRKALAPGESEIRVNPRARSAKLRVAELLDPNPERP